MTLVYDTDDEGFSALAAALLFTIEPTDRALAGWGDDTAADDLADMAHAAAGWQVVR
jgi:hypothetical protein